MSRRERTQAGRLSLSRTSKELQIKAEYGKQELIDRLCMEWGSFRGRKALLRELFPNLSEFR